MPKIPIFATQNNFKVVIDGITEDNEYFYSVEGLSIQYTTRTYSPGGDNMIVNITTDKDIVPLVFKRPLSDVTLGMSKWCIKTLEMNEFKPADVNIFIFGRNDSITNHWIAEQAYPIGMKVSSLNVLVNDPRMMEILTLTYSNLKRIK